MTLRRTDKPIPKPVKAEKKPKRLKPRSAKRAALAPVRAEFVRQRLAENPVCQMGPMLALALGPRFSHGGRWMGCRDKAVDVHEVLTRARQPGPETILTRENTRTGCRPCHDFVTTHPKDAERAGLMARSPAGAYANGAVFARKTARAQGDGMPTAEQHARAAAEMETLMGPAPSVERDIAAWLRAAFPGVPVVTSGEWDAMAERAVAFRERQDHTLETCKTGGCEVCSPPWVPT